MRAVIADDSVLLREGIARLLAEGGIEVAAGVGDAAALLAAVGELRPELAIIDVRMPPEYRDEGLRAAIEIRRRWPEVALLVLSQFVEERYATELLAGDTRAVGYLLKDRVADIERVHRGGPSRRRRRHRARPGGRPSAAGPQPESRPAGPAHPQGARGTRPDGGRAVQRRHRRGARGHAGAVEKHIASIFMKLDLPADDEQRHRRVMAVVRYLNS